MGGTPHPLITRLLIVRPFVTPFVTPFVAQLAVVLLCVVALAPSCNCGLEELATPVPRMVVEPERVVVARADVAQDTRIVVRVTNPSIVDLEDLQARLDNADPAFELRSAPDEVEAGDTVEVVVVVRPLTVTTLNATLVLTAADPAVPARVDVPIVVTSVDAGFPDICNTPESITFVGVGRSDIGRADVRVENCGIRDLLLDEVFFCPRLLPGEPADPLHPECGVDSTIRFPTPVARGTPVQSGAGASLQLLFSPLDVVPHDGDVVILSNDPDENPVVIPVTGTGAECPTACIELVDGAEGIEPFDTVRIDGRCSAPAGEGVGPAIEAWAWQLEQRPVGSTAVLSSETADRVELPVDLAGRYCVRLEATDAAGVRSCEPAVQCFDAIPTEELLVQLVWDHPTADFDLHMVRAGGQPFTHEGDCYFSNRRPLDPPWSSVPEENPVLDRDDSRGYGPENLHIVAPAPGSRWRVFVHYWNKQTDDIPRSNATVRAFVYGQQVIEVSRTFEDDEQLWQALDLTWSVEPGGPASIAQPGLVQDFPRPF